MKKEGVSLFLTERTEGLSARASCKFAKSSSIHLKEILASASGLIVQTIITLVVTFLLLFNKEKYHLFFMQVVKASDLGDCRYDFVCSLIEYD